MSTRTVRTVKPPTSGTVNATISVIAWLPYWRQTLKLILDHAVAEMRRRGPVPEEIHRAFEEFGGYCRVLAKEIRIENRKHAWAAKEAAKAKATGA